VSQSRENREERQVGNRHDLTESQFSCGTLTMSVQDGSFSLLRLSDGMPCCEYGTSPSQVELVSFGESGSSGEGVASEVSVRGESISLLAFLNRC
jgi:hypothetical protein